MRAVINRGTDKEISWDLDEYITPELVNEIAEAGRAKNINWRDSPLYELMEILLDKISREELEEMIYDEDPQIIDLLEAELLTYTRDGGTKGVRELARLYLPVLLVILGTINK